MKPFTRYERAVVATTVAAGMGVALTAAMASAMSIEEKPKKELEAEQCDSDEGDFELTLPTLPESKEEAMKLWVEGYVNNRDHLEKLFKMAGQILVAPVALIVFDAIYEWYKERK